MTDPLDRLATAEEQLVEDARSALAIVTLCPPGEAAVRYLEGAFAAAHEG